MKNQAAVSNRAPKANFSVPTRVSTGTEPMPMEPSILMRAQELLNHIGNLEREHAVLRGSLFGTGEETENAPVGLGLESALADACTRTACMVGDMATINGKVAR